MKRNKALFSFICLFMAGGAVMAAPDEGDVDTIVVTADRYREPAPTAKAIQEKQANTAVITAETIEQNGYTSVQDALKQVNGVTMTEQVPGISSYIRLNGDDRVLVLVDGQPITNPQSAAYGRGTVDLQTLPGVDHVERIEVTKGSGSVRYGSGAVGGVVNIITKKGDAAPTTTLDVNTGSWGIHNYMLTTSGSAGNTSWYVTGSLGHRKYYKFDDGGYDTDESRGDYNKDAFTARIDERLNDDSSLTFYAFHTNFAGHGTTFKQDKGTGNYYISANKRIERLNNNYSLTYHFGETGDTPGFIRYFNNYSKNLWTYHFNSRYQGVQAENSWRLDDHNVLTAGVEWTKDEGSNAEVGYVDKERTNRAVYVENVMTFGKLNITPGIRLDDNSEFGFHKTPRIAVNYQANDKWNVYANWRRVFAAPKLNDLYYYLVSPDKTSKGDPNLKAETGYTQNIGVTYQRDDKTRFNVNFFRSSLADAIRWDRGETEAKVRNLDKEEKTGAEISLNKIINDYWDYELGYSYIHTKIDEGKGMHVDETFNRPNGYHAGVHFHKNTWKANVTMNAGTGRNDDYYMHGSYVTWDAGLSYDVTEVFTMYAQVYNLTDEGYDLYHNYPSAGRFWLVGAKYAF